MPNDAKLGMLAGVCGVIIAAVVFGQPPEPTAQPPPPANAQAREKGVAPAPATASATNTAEPPATPIARTKPDVDGQPASRQPGANDEP